MLDTCDLPGAARVHQGLSDLAAGRRTPEALLVCVAAGRLRTLGLDVETGEAEPELLLYGALVRQAGPTDDPYQRYNAWLRELTSFLEAAERRARGPAQR